MAYSRRFCGKEPGHSETFSDKKCDVYRTMRHMPKAVNMEAELTRVILRIARQLEQSNKKGSAIPHG